MEIQERVAAGIKVLGIDRCLKLDLEILDVGDLALCPIGQLFGGKYVQGLIALGINEGNLDIDHGFEDQFHEYAELTAEWKHQLRELNDRVMSYPGP